MAGWEAGCVATPYHNYLKLGRGIVSQPTDYGFKRAKDRVRV